MPEMPPRHQVPSATTARTGRPFLLREPLIHFLLIGAALFLLDTTLNPRSASAPVPYQIVVDAGKIESLVHGFEQSKRRPPSAEERSALIEEYVREEVYYREGLSLGLDRDDPVVRQRVREKVEAMTPEPSEERAPTDAELKAVLDADPERFSARGRYDFEQVFIDPRKTGGDAAARAASVLTRLQSPLFTRAAPRELSDRGPLPQRLQGTSRQQLSLIFGAVFAAEVLADADGRWNGPYRSTLGLHLVRVVGNADFRPPALEEVRDVVEQTWRRQQFDLAREAYYQTLRSRYSIDIRPNCCP